MYYSKDIKVLGYSLHSHNISITKVAYQDTRFIYKQHFCKQYHAEIGKKIEQKVNNTLKLNFCY